MTAPVIVDPAAHIALISHDHAWHAHGLVALLAEQRRALLTSSVRICFLLARLHPRVTVHKGIKGITQGTKDSCPGTMLAPRPPIEMGYLGHAPSLGPRSSQWTHVAVATAV